MDKAILETKELIKEFIYKNGYIDFNGDFSGYKKDYFTTNEKIGSYLDIKDISDKRNALSVTSSGDHSFNLITKGILEIDTFDINKLSELLTFGLKMAIFIKNDYKGCLVTFSKLLSEKTSNLEITSIISDLIPYMEEKYRIFWREILDFNYNIQKLYSLNINIINILCRDRNDLKTVIFNNNYLRDEESYNKFKNNLGKANITFNVVDAENLAGKFKNKEYDLLLLSNVLDYFAYKWGFYWKYKKLDHYINDLKRITKDDGIIFLYYLFLYEYKGPNDEYVKTTFYMSNSDIKESDLKNLEIYSLVHPFAEDKSGIILKRC